MSTKFSWKHYQPKKFNESINKHFKLCLDSFVNTILRVVSDEGMQQKSVEVAKTNFIRSKICKLFAVPKFVISFCACRKIAKQNKYNNNNRCSYKASSVKSSQLTTKLTQQHVESINKNLV